MLYYTLSFYKKMFSSSRSNEYDNEDYEHFSEYSSDFWCWYKIFSRIYTRFPSFLLCITNECFENNFKSKFPIVSNIFFLCFDVSYFFLLHNAMIWNKDNVYVYFSNNNFHKNLFCNNLRLIGHWTHVDTCCVRSKLQSHVLHSAVTHNIVWP